MDCSYEIITDSSCNLTEDLIDKFGLHILSLLYYVEGKENRGYIKGETFDYPRFYDLLRSQIMITTSLANLEFCREMCTKILESGKDILYIGFSSALSGTFSAVSMVLKEMRDEYPDRKILFEDTLSASLGEGLIVYQCGTMRLEGKPIDETYKWLVDNKFNVCAWFTVDDLFYLKRGGRVSASTAIVGSLLNVKPILHVDDEGRLINVGKVRGRKKSLDELLDKMEELADPREGQTVFISHGDCLKDAEYVEQQIRSRFKVKDVIIHYVEPVIATHSGPGTLALFFMGTKR